MTSEDSTQALPSRTPEGQRPLRTPVDEDEARSIRRAIGLGLVIWPVFIVLDLFMCGVVYPEAAVEPFVVYRILGECGILFAYWLVRERGASRRMPLVANAIMCVVTSVLVSVMALSLGGLVSPYMHGISVIVLVEGAAIASPFRKSIVVTLPTALAYPAVMAAASPFDADLRASLTSVADLAAFISHYIFVLSSAVIAAAVSHSVWRARRELQEVRRLRRYRLEAPIGKGGMNDVWLAWDEPLKRQVALKILRSTDPDALALSRFEREARATSRLSSPHTIRIHDFGASEDGVYFIAMEYLQGMDLRELVRRYGPVAPARAVHFALQACRSLAEAHENGIVHRDIKPANLFLTRIDDDEDGIKVLDFGVARVRLPDIRATLSHPGIAVGTPAYMAPETLVGSAADERSDVYSLGATLYDLLTGVPPFPSDNVHAVFAAHVSEKPLPPSVRLSAPLPSGLEQVVLRCLEKQPADRFGSVRELAAALEGCIDGPSWSAGDAHAWWERVRLEPLGAPGETPLDPGLDDTVRARR